MNLVALLLMAWLLGLSAAALAGEDRAFLVVYPNGKYVLPSGETVVVEGSKTSGLQEAIGRAVKDGLELPASQRHRFAPRSAAKLPRPAIHFPRFGLRTRATSRGAWPGAAKEQKHLGW